MAGPVPAVVACKNYPDGNFSVILLKLPQCSKKNRCEAPVMARLALKQISRAKNTSRQLFLSER